MNDYIRKHNAKRIELLEAELSFQEKQINNLEIELEQLSKLIHKDNKLIPAMYLSVSEFMKLSQAHLLSDPDLEQKAQELINSLSAISSDRERFLSNQLISSTCRYCTNYITINALLNYMAAKANKFEIDLDIYGLSNISFLLNTTVSESDFSTLLADLLENAIHSTEAAINKIIRLSFELDNDIFVMYIEDSGSNFPINVLQFFGEKRITTHSTGSGIGIITTCEFLKKYRASFQLEEYGIITPFTKKISIRFDNENVFTIRSFRKDILAESLQTKKWVLMHSTYNAGDNT